MNEELQTYDSDTSFKPDRQVDLIPVIDRVNQRLNSADEAALQQVRSNNATRVKNAQNAGKDLIALSELSKTLTDQLVERQKGINEDERAQGKVDGYQDWLTNSLDTTQVTEGIEAAKQQNVVAQDVSSEVLGSNGENYEAAAAIGKATTWREVGRRQGYAMAAVAGYDSFVDDKLAGVEFNSSAEYAAARAEVQKQFFKEAGLSGVKPQFLAKNVYPAIMKDDLAAVSKWKQRFAVDDSAKQRDELASSFSATNDVGSYLSAARNTVDGQGNPLGYKGAWDEFSNMVVEQRQAGLISDADVESMKNQPIPGDAKGRTYGDLHEAKFENIQRQVDAQQRTDWNNEQADRNMVFQKEEQAAIDAFLDSGDTDGYTDDQLDDVADALEKKYGMPATKLRNLGANSVNAEMRDRQEEEIESLMKLNLLTPDRLAKYDPILQRKYNSIAGQTAKLRKENDNFTPQNDAIEDKIKFLVKLDPMSSADPAVAMFVTKMQQEFQQEVTRLAVTGDPNPAGTALGVILGKIDQATAGFAGNPKQITEFYSSQTIGKLGTPAGNTAARFEGLREALKTPTSIEDSYLLKPDELKAAVRGYGKPGFTPGPAVEFIAQRLNVDPLTVLNKQLELNDMDPLPPSPAMEFVNTQTPQQKQLLERFKTPERSARGLASGTFAPEVVPKGYGKMVSEAAKANGIPPSILSGLIETESGWNSNAMSPAGAKGLAQFMDPTAAEFGVNVYDPKSSIDGAARYLKYLVDYFKGDMRLAIFAYNGGMGNIERYGGPIPGNAENQEYYDKVMKGSYKYGNGKQTLSDPSTMRPSIAAQIPR